MMKKNFLDNIHISTPEPRCNKLNRSTVIGLLERGFVKQAVCMMFNKNSIFDLIHINSMIDLVDKYSMITFFYKNSLITLFYAND